MSVAPDVLALLVRRAREHAASGATGRLLVVVDGPAGSGKTTLAAQLAAPLAAQVVHMDDLYAGWDGVEEGVRVLHDDVLTPWSRGEDASYRRYDWVAGRRAERRHVSPSRPLLVEGCHAGRRPVDALDPFTVWVEAPDDVRLVRGLERDGAGMREQWLGFMTEERAAYERDRTWERAAVVLDGVGAIVASRPRRAVALGTIAPTAGGSRDDGGAPDGHDRNES
ncbi:uridine kinase family protein [Luteimicrobium subarcticum]|uniref:AAA domain-containing protein n=1 Tax=Luteimicrobium subarcticum TaxID=620910 RepID=A0A2M8WTR4_9MICO|nr:AAA family ATPase [Luteimicrobium subarcticum]PJI94289.1 AAA domain-containing protein [Luteimicrobium subarcticum]